MSVPTQGVAAPSTFTADQERTFAMWCHMVAILGSFLLPLALWTYSKGRSPFVDSHGKEAVNFGLSQALGVGFCVLAFFSALFHPVFAIISIAAWMYLILGNVVRPIRAGFRAHHGELHRYGFIIHFLK